MAEPKLPLLARKNIKEYEEKMNEYKERMTKAVDLSAEVTIDANYPALHTLSDTEGYKNRVGEVVSWFVEALAKCFESNFAEETAKAALQGSWTTGVVRIQTGTLKKGEHKYQELDIDNGDLVITVYKVGNVGGSFPELIHKLGDSSSGLSVKASQSLKEHEEKKNEILQEIQEAVDLSCDVTLDCDYQAFAPKVDEAGYKDRLGEVVEWYIDALKQTINNNYKGNDTAKAALQSAWTTGVIKLEWGTLKKNEHKYVETSCRDGDLVVVVYKIGNTSNTGSDLLEKLGDASGLPLKSALNLKEHEEKKEENLQKIQEAVGLSGDVTLDVDFTVLDPLITKAGYTNRIGEVVYDWIVGGLANRLKSICADEMTKEAVAEAWTTGVIRLEENKKVDYHACEFTNGDLVIQYRPDRICSNVSNIGSDIESKL